MNDVAILFFNGVDEKVIPEIRLTKSKDGEAGQAFFRFVVLTYYCQIILKKYRECI